MKVGDTGVLSRARFSVHNALTVHEAGQIPIIRVGVDLKGELGERLGKWNDQR